MPRGVSRNHSNYQAGYAAGVEYAKKVEDVVPGNPGRAEDFQTLEYLLRLVNQLVASLKGGK